MTEIPAPSTGAEHSFKNHYRRLVLGSIQRAAASETELQRALGHPLRARRAERRARELSRLSAETAFRRQSDARALERALRGVWAAAFVVLLASLLLFGVRSWWSGGCDVSLIVVSFAWFFAASSESLVRPRPQTSAGPADGAPGQ